MRKFLPFLLVFAILLLAVQVQAMAQAPAIISQPSATAITGGQRVGFSVAASGTGLAYQWQMSRDGGSTFADIIDGRIYSGTKTERLWIDKVPISMDGFLFRAQVTKGTTSVSQEVTLTVLASPLGKANTWQTVGSPGFSRVDSDFISHALDSKGTPYVASADSYIDEWGFLHVGITVKKLGEKGWQTVGQEVFTDGSVGHTKLTLDASDTPYIIYSDKKYDQKISVMRFNGREWETVGQKGFSTGLASFPSIAFDSKGVPFIAYLNRVPDAWGVYSSDVTVMRLDGTAWEMVGATGFAGNSPSLALGTDGIPYVAFQDYVNGNKATVKRFDGKVWETVGVAGFSEGMASFTSLALDTDGAPYITYMDGAANWRATVKRFSGSRWETVGKAGFSAGELYFLSLALGPDGSPFVAYRDDSGVNNKATVMRFDGDSWGSVGPSAFTPVPAYSTGIAIDKEGIPYIGFLNGSYSGKTTVMRFGSTIPNKPTVVGGSNCGPGSVTLSASAAPGETIRWYGAASGGVYLATGGTYTTPSLTANTTFYVAAVSASGIEGDRSAVTATVKALPPAPVVNTEVSYCLGSPAAALTGTGSGLKWYTAAEGGTGISTAPIPATTSAGTMDYYVSQAADGCESPRSKITVTVTALPSVSLAPFANAVCSTNTSFRLTGGLPTGGTYSGPGVIDGTFNATAVGTGTHAITYSYTANGCTVTAMRPITVSTCTGTREESPKWGMSLYPNPTAGSLRLSLTLPRKMGLEVRLLDARGREVLRQSFPKAAEGFSYALELGDRPKGVYLLQVIGEDGVITRRVIKE